MLKEAIEKILSLAPIQIKEIGGFTYAKNSLSRVDPPKFEQPTPQVFHTLSGLVAFTTGRKVEFTGELYCHIVDQITVAVKNNLNPEAGNIRFKYAEAKCIEDRFGFGRWYPLEDFIVAVQSQFVMNDVISQLIDHLGHLANENVTENKDDGFSQSIQIRTGITTKSSVKIENPLSLKPFRTFREVEQPESMFIFRLRNQGSLQCSLYESDGGAWKLAAIESIKKYLTDELKDIQIFG